MAQNRDQLWVLVDEPSGIIKGGEFFDWPSEYLLFKKDFASWR
jgi:hypothetical protein